MNWFMAFLGGVAQTYANYDESSPNWGNPPGASWWLGMDNAGLNDKYRFAQPIIRTHQEIPHQSWDHDGLI